MPKVSVIVPAYNVELYIEDLLHSLINQTLEDVEFIIVDDGSTDKTGDIIKSYTEFDNRINYIKHSENKGLMLARKTGYDIATGEYIMFLDGDDTFRFDACEKAYKAIKKENVDVLQYGVNIFGEEEELEESYLQVQNLNLILKPLGCKVYAPSKAGLLGAKACKDTLSFSTCNKIYRREIISEVSKYIPNEHIVMAEDVLFSYITCFLAKSYSSIDSKLYNYRFGSGVSTGIKITDSRINALAKCYFIYDYLEKWTKKMGAFKACEKRLNSIKMQMLRNVGDGFLIQVPKSKLNEYVDSVLKYCPLETFISIITYLADGEQIVKCDEYAERCAILDIFKTNKNDSKTIATFYYKVNNGGVENVISQLTDIWVKNGHNVVLFTEEPANDNDYYINPKVKRVVLSPYQRGNYNTYVNRVKELRHYLQKYNVDIMVDHAWLFPHIVSDEIIVKSMGIPFIVHTHGVFCADYNALDVYSAYANANAHKMYSLADTIVALNEVDEVYWSSFGLNAIKTINPIAMNLNTNVSPLNGKNILMVCRISKEKQILDAIKIAQKVSEKIPEVTLNIVGEGDKHYKNTLIEYIKNNKLENVVKMVGFKKNIASYYQSSDVMLFTSMYEGSPLALLESKICGLPLVTYQLLNVDTIRNGKGMFVVPQSDIDEASERIIEILSDDNLKKKMGKEARESAEEILSFDIAKHWEYIFEETLNPSNQSCKITSEHTAINTLVHYTSQGILNRMQSGVPIYSPQSSSENLNNVSLQHQYIDALEATIKEIRSSTSYRLGWFLTTIPRKIKDFIKGQKYVE